MEYTEENFKKATNADEFDFVCKKCGKTFKRTKREIINNKGIPQYCSKECAKGSNHRGYIIVKCAECGEDKQITLADYTKKMKRNPNANFFCDKSCAAKYNNRKYVKKTKKESVCPICGEEKNTSAKICKKCREKQYEANRERELGYYIGYDEKIKYTAYALSKVRADAKRVMENNKDVEKVCMFCKDHAYDEILEVHHLKGIMKFDPHTKISQINSTSNLVWLCPNHHKMLEKGLIKLE